jgi:hypothetical protein
MAILRSAFLNDTWELLVHANADLAFQRSFKSLFDPTQKYPEGKVLYKGRPVEAYIWFLTKLDPEFSRFSSLKIYQSEQSYENTIKVIKEFVNKERNVQLIKAFRNDPQLFYKLNPQFTKIESLDNLPLGQRAKAFGDLMLQFELQHISVVLPKLTPSQLPVVTPPAKQALGKTEQQQQKAKTPEQVKQEESVIPPSLFEPAIKPTLTEQVSKAPIPSVGQAEKTTSKPAPVVLEKASPPAVKTGEAPILTTTIKPQPKTPFAKPAEKEAVKIVEEKPTPISPVVTYKESAPPAKQSIEKKILVQKPAPTKPEDAIDRLSKRQEYIGQKETHIKFRKAGELPARESTPQGGYPRRLSQVSLSGLSKSPANLKDFISQSQIKGKEIGYKLADTTRKVAEDQAKSVVNQGETVYNDLFSNILLKMASSTGTTIAKPIIFSILIIIGLLVIFPFYVDHLESSAILPIPTTRSANGS